nr:RNA-directed DNA polymerase, eukaryota, reverse transcriptase zinc-binding domain protein [Tanacetum cinerariifolium]
SHDRPTFNTNNLPPKRSYASVTHAESRNNLSQQSKLDNIKSIQLNDDDLILVEDSSTVVLIKFSSVNSCEAFKSNESLNKLWTFIKVRSPSFVVDERVIWIEVSGLPLCAWGSSAFKKIANLFGKFNFFDDEVEDSMCMGRPCITTKIQSLISEKVNVTIKDLNFNSNDMDSNESDDDHDMEEHRSTNEDVDPNAALDDFIQQNIVKESDLKDSKKGDQANVSTHVAGDNETLFFGKVKEEYFVTKEDKPSEEYVSDMSKPPGFKNFIKENSECSISSNASRSVILFGDLNEVRNVFERFGSIFSSGDAAIFNDFIQESGLIDLPMGGRSFTWMNKVGSKMSKLDRFLISDNVNQDIPNLQVMALDRRWSDHNLILLHSKNFDFGPTPFKIFHSWFDQIDFEKVVKDKWDDITGEVLDIKEAFLNFYKKKFSCYDSQFSFPSFMPDHHLNTSDQDLLKAVVSMEETKTAVWDCSSNKDPGVNSAFITLILKVSNPLFIKDYKPISLIGLYYKIVAKILFNRLSKVIDSIISPEQSDFISDFEKAFDSVSWKYLDYMLYKLGFGSRWRTWINNCLMSARTSILIYGSPTSEFSLKRGLRQGDPLPPFLFIIVIEGLYMALNDGIASNMFHGVRIGSNIHLLHLFYAKDVIILSNWNQNDMEYIIRILNIFYIAFRHKINFHKSNVFRVGVSNSKVVSMVACTGCEAGSFPFSYLGLPIGSNMSRIANWQILIDHFKARLSG